MDDDGVDIGKRVPIRVKVIMNGDEMTVDLSDVSPQVQRLLQLRPEHRALAARRWRSSASPRRTDYPINDGSFRPLKVIAAAGHGGERGQARRRCAAG